MERNKPAPFVADTDEQFLALSPDLRLQVARAELDLRNDLSKFLDTFPPLLANSLTPTVMDVPARFVRALLPFFAGIDALLRSAKELAEQIEQLQKQALQDAGGCLSRFGDEHTQES